MSNLAALFSGVNFRATIQRYCAENGWKIAQIDGESAQLKFSMNSGRSQTLLISRYESTLEFCAMTMAIFPSEDKIPHYLSTLLLKQNAQKKIGFWCIEEIGGDHVFSYMHNAELELIDSNYFGRVVRAVIKQCDDLEGALVNILRR
jgi:hypothetical protein